ncbi:MAG: hypothetical protein MZU97_01285 [Bacillus subtilis]|nr:hypothetical protein [Bacillus subtilis]
MSLSGTAFSTSVSDVDGVRYGFTNRITSSKTELTNLLAATEYRYRIWDGLDASTVRTFTTAPADSGLSLPLHDREAAIADPSERDDRSRFDDQSPGTLQRFHVRPTTGDGGSSRGGASLHWDWFL